MDPQVQKSFYNRFHKWRAAQLLAAGDDPVAERRIRKAVDLRRLTWQGRKDLVRRFLAEDEFVTAEARAWALNFYGDKAKEAETKKKNEWIKARSVLLTWNGSWGLISLSDSVSQAAESHSPPSEMAAAESQSPPTESHSPPLAESCLTHLLREHPRVQALWTSFQNGIKQWVDKLAVDTWAACLEVCLQTYSQKQEVRVHAHLFIRSPSKIRVQSQRYFLWQGSLPHTNASVMGMTGRKMSSSNCGLYYLQCPKRGSLFSVGNVIPFHDYLVSGEWLFNLLQADKIDIDVAKQEIVKSAKNLPRLLQSLEKLDSERKRLKVGQIAADVDAHLRSEARPFVVLPQVTAWLLHFTFIQSRYQFLVLDGPSRTGKTQFALNLGARDEVLEVNMAAAPEADLRGYDALRHSIIVYDEISPEQVLRQKKLFQAGNSSVLLGASSTNCHSYSVWVHRKKMICCSNLWQYKLQTLPAVDADWLRANSVLVDVQSPLFVQ